MRIGKVIGKVSLSKRYPSLRGARWLLVAPLGREILGGDRNGRGEPYIVYDELGAGVGSLLAVSEGAEASAPFHPDQKPIDAYNAAILDHIEIDPNEV